MTEYTSQELEAERWLPVVGYEDEYAISDLGRMKRTKDSCYHNVYRAGRMLNPSIIKNGYATFVLRGSGGKKRVYVHRLVMAAFVGPCPNKYEVNHINSCRDDNRLGNLEYVTRSENNRHAVKSGRWGQRGTSGPSNAHWRVPDDDVRSIRLLHAGGRTYASLSKQFGINWTSIRSIVKRETHKYVD